MTKLVKRNAFGELEISHLGRERINDILENFVTKPNQRNAERYALFALIEDILNENA